MSADFDRDQLLDIFVAEAGDDMARFGRHYGGPRNSGPCRRCRSAYGRAQVKGAALLCGFPGLGQLGALLEETLERVGNSPAKWLLRLKSCARLSSPFNPSCGHRAWGSEDASVVEGSFVAVPRIPAVADSLAPRRPIPQLRLLTTISFPVIDGEVLSYFFPEAEEYLHTIQTLLRRLERHGGYRHDSSIVSSRTHVERISLYRRM